MGVIKFLAKMVIQNLAMRCITKFTAWCFGIFLCSRSSLIPQIKGEIVTNGLITFTHSNMTISEAC